MKEIKVIQQAKSWKDLNRTLKKLIKNNKSKLAGDIFEYLTKYFLEVAPQYKTKLRKVYLLKEVPSSLKIKLNLPNTDEGIDLIAETFDGEYWAIQCKFRSDNTETLKVKGDLSTFNNLAFTVCKNISHGIVCATVNRPPKKIKLLNSVGFELLTTWLGLDRDNGQLFKEIKSKSVGKIEKPKKLSPRPHQKQAIGKTISYFKNNERGKMIMPCGTGKSLTAFWIAEKMRPKSILIAVPSLALLQQTLKVWTREFLLNNIQPDWLCVCSDDTVKEEQDDFVTFSADLGIKVDTDPRVIRNFLRNKTSKIKIVFTTYQSGKATAIGSKGFDYDLGIMDEAHKTVGSGSKPMAHLLHQKNIKIKKRLFMTATERLFKGDSDEYMSMDDPRDYGNLIYELSFKEAINSKPPIISDYKIITFGITNPEIEEITQTNKYLEVKKELKDITARELATAIALRKAIKKLKIKNAISFHRSIKRAENFRKQQDLITKIYPTYGKLKTFHVRGDMPTSDRALEMLAFEEDKGLMTNARCLTEGVDLPAIDCVCFTDPKRSKVDIVQAAGRALRLSKGKKFGYILIPIFIPDGVDFNEAAEQQGFDDVSITVRALATTDKRIVEYLRAVSEGKKPGGGSPVEGVTSINNLYKVEAEEFNNAVKLKIWEKVAYRNWRPFEEAKDYVKSLNLNNAKEFRNYYGRKHNFPMDIPMYPDDVYRNKGWKGWGDYLGTGNLAPGQIKYFSYEEAKNFIKKFKIQSVKEYNKLFKEKIFPKEIPNNAQRIYFKKGWVSWGEYLGNNKVNNRDKSKIFISLNDLREECRKYNLTSYKSYSVFRKKNNKLTWPSEPMNIYKGLKNNGYLFGEKNYVQIIPYVEAKKYIQKYKFKSEGEFKIFQKSNNLKLKGIPNNCARVYANKGWKGWPEFLGHENVATFRYKNINFKEVRKIVRKLNIPTKEKYRPTILKRKLKIPLNPDGVFKNRGWVNWSDFLGSGNISPAQRRKMRMSFEEAKIFVRKLKIKNSSEWRKYLKSKKRPINLPSMPDRSYKNDGWKDWPDFLGN